MPENFRHKIVNLYCDFEVKKTKGVKGSGVFPEPVRQLSIGGPWESGGASDNVMVHLLRVREGAEVSEEEGASSQIE